MTKKEEANALEQLLSSTEKRKKKEYSIDTDEGLNEKTYVPDVETREWSGLQIPVQISDICEYYKSVLSSKGIYSVALDFQIYNAAVQYYIYNQMVLMMCDPKCPLTTKPKPKDITSTGEGLRHSLRELGITRGINDRTNTKNLQDHNDPIADMLKNISEQDNDDEDTVIRRKK